MLRRFHSCSLSCYKIHRETHSQGLNPPPRPESPEQQAAVSQDRDTTPQVDKAGLNGTPQASRNQFDVLLSSARLNTLFQRYPSLRSQLEQIFAVISGPLPPSPGSRDQSQKRFGRGDFHGRGRGRGGGPPWMPERGIIDGLSHLKRAKEFDGVEGEGMREFMHLVLKSTTGASGHLSSAENVGEAPTEKSPPN